MNIAIIPARGGSKRLPGKNIKLLAGKPMIVWSVEAALDSGIFDKVIVSTDSDKIAKIAIDIGANVPFIRPSFLARDETTTNDVVCHVVDYVEKHESKAIETITILQPTSPLRNFRHIRDAWWMFKERKAKAIVSVCKLEYPIELCNKLGLYNSLDGFVVNENIRRSQDFESSYRLNGAIYIIDRCLVGNLSALYNKGSYAYVMDNKSSVDVDTLVDFELAEFYFKRRHVLGDC
uniref:acylneuraminate cytidylyltransferase family protein n=1 Tax=Marinobacterium profundum TaxID=1714300 RepID=UPI00082AC2D5|nr:acylneuraminate cytidylyltransferase family protein [Marinobacterium profundum]